MNLKISIIVPVYNVEKYLAKCIESILNQTFSDFELILVNDGSQDNSLSICYEYQLKDNRIKVINKKNGGVSTARNIGLENAQGEYIAFVDPDDDIEVNMYEIMFKKAKDFEVDMVVCGFNYIDLVEKQSVKRTLWPKINCIISKEEIAAEVIPEMLSQQRGFGLYTVWNKLYKRELFIDNNLRFEVGRHHGEDTKLNLLLLNFVNKMIFIEDDLYNYYIRERQSLTRVVREDFYDYIIENDNFYRYLCKKYNCENLISKGTKTFLDSTISYMINVVNSNLDVRKKYKIVNSILNHETFQEYIKNYNYPKKVHKLLFYKLLVWTYQGRLVISSIVLMKLLKFKANVSSMVNKNIR